MGAGQTDRPTDKQAGFQDSRARILSHFCSTRATRRYGGKRPQKSGETLQALFLAEVEVKVQQGLFLNTAGVIGSELQKGENDGRWW